MGLTPATRPVELRARSAFSLLDGTTTPEALAEAAAALGYSHFALVDSADLGGVPRFVRAAKNAGIKPVVGNQLNTDAGTVALIARNVEGFHNLSALVTKARLKSQRGRPSVTISEIIERANGLHLLTGGPGGVLSRALLRGDHDAADTLAARLRDAFGDKLSIEQRRHFAYAGESSLNAGLAKLAATHGIATVASAAPRYLNEDGRLIHDIYTAIRAGLTLDEAEARGILRPNGNWVLRGPDHLASVWRDSPSALDRTLQIAEACTFDIGWMRPPMPRIASPENEPRLLRERTYAGARERWGERLTDRQSQQLEHELSVITRLGFAGYFLVLWDIIRFARSRGILCQGRGSAANSAVAYCLGITSVDPVANRLLFERFLSDVRVDGQAEAPDIDVDFEADRREEVLNYIYEKYGRDHAAIACVVQTYHAPSALQDAMRALGYSADLSRRLSKRMRWMSPSEGAELLEGGLAAAEGLSLTDSRGRALLSAMRHMDDLPRIRSTHPGGFVISSEPLGEHIAIERTGSGRTILQFDKDDLDDAGIPKLDILGLGGLAAVRKAFDAVYERTGERLELYSLPTDDPATFELIRSGETVGMFQLESRAQIASLLKTQPENLYDVVVQLALIRPGPIQANFVQPYTRRRRGLEPVTFAHPALEPILGRTMGIPIFQEQAMAISMALCGFTAAQADELRRSMGHQKKLPRLQRTLTNMKQAMLERGVSAGTAESIVEDLVGFANYGFPESHSWSFALIAYASAYLKAHYPAEFYLGILNSWPMGFYPASTLVHDARRRGIEVLPPCLARGEWDCTLEDRGSGRTPALRIGWRHIHGLKEETRDRLRRAREEAPFVSIDDIVRRAGLSRTESLHLARAGAMEAFEEGRRAAAWEALGKSGDRLPLAPAAFLPFRPTEMSGDELIFLDYLATGISVRGHPVEHLRDRLRAANILGSIELRGSRPRLKVRTAGLVVARQHPVTANGTVFLLLEDEGGFTNIIVPREVYRQNKEVVNFSPFLLVEGRLEKDDSILNVVASGFQRLDAASLRFQSRDFR